MREVSFNASDFDLFDWDVSPTDYEFFKKHTGAFKRMLEDQPRTQKMKFVEDFKTFSINHGCMKGFPTKSENFYGYLDEATAYYQEHFVDGKFSSARNLVQDVVSLAQNRHNLQYMGAASYAKDPFFNKETRDVFRRLFGHPSEKGTCLKVVCVLPLHVKFGGALCRYLRRWLDAEEKETETTDSESTASATKNSSATTKSSDAPNQSSEKPSTMNSTQNKTTEKPNFKTEERTFNFSAFKAPFSASQFEVDADALAILASDFLKAQHDQYEENERMRKEKAQRFTLSDYLGVSGNESSKKNVEKPKELDIRDFPAEVSKNKFPFEFMQIPRKSDSKEQSREKETSVMKDIRASSRSYSRNTKASAAESDEEEWERRLIRQRELKEDNDKPALKNCEVYKIEKDGTFTNLKDMFAELHLGKPHPDKIFEELQAKRKEEAGKKEINTAKRQELASKLKDLQCPPSRGNTGFGVATTNNMKVAVKKTHACANCRQVEPNPKTFKKCQRCKGKRTRFYCSRDCQADDWLSRHREEHSNTDPK